jgi:hypothetical protein
MADKKIVGKISRQWTARQEERDDYIGYDDIVAMKNDGIPNLRDEDYYVQFTSPIGRDIVQQATNIYSTQSPKWDVLPRGLGDIDVAEKMERAIEWHFFKAAQMGEKRFHSQALIHAIKYNRVCAQLEWLDDYQFCVKLYHPGTIVYEYGSKLQWVAVVNNVSAVSILEHWNDFAQEPSSNEARTKKNGGVYNADKIDAALKRIQKFVDDDEEQRMMYVDYTDEKTRHVYCWPVSDDKIDDSFGYDDEGKEVDDLITIQDKDNSLGFINWAVATGEGDPILAPLLKANLYQNINDAETIKRTKAYRIVFEPMYLQEGVSTERPDIDYSGGQVVITAPVGSKLTKLNPTPLDPAFNELSAQDNQIARGSIGVGDTANIDISNVQHSTLATEIRLRLAQLDPARKVGEQVYTQLAHLMFRWAKKNKKVLKAVRLYSKNDSLLKGSEIVIEPDEINLDALYITCVIMPNNENDKMGITNQISMLKQSGVAIDDDQFIEMLNMGSPEVLRTKYEKQEIRRAALEAQKITIQGEAQNILQQEMAKFQAQLQIETNAAMQQMQMAQQAQMMQQMPQQQIPGQVAPDQGIPMPSDQAMQSQGFNGAAGGMAPQTANPDLTQAQR